MYDGRTSRGTARGDTELTVNRTQVCIGSARTDNELFGDLGGGQPQCHQAQDFDFASGQAEGVPTGRRCLRQGRRSYPSARLGGGSDLLSHVHMFCGADGLSKCKCSPLGPGCLEGCSIKLDTYAGYHTLIRGAVGWRKGSANGVAQCLCRSIQPRCAQWLSLPLGDACQSLQGSSDAFFVSECLPQGQALIVVCFCLRIAPLGQCHAPQNSERMGAPAFISELLSYRKAFLTKHSRSLIVAPLQHCDGESS